MTWLTALLEPLLLWNRIMERREKRAEGWRWLQDRGNSSLCIDWSLGVLDSGGWSYRVGCNLGDGRALMMDGRVAYFVRNKAVEARSMWEWVSAPGLRCCSHHKSMKPRSSPIYDRPADQFACLYCILFLFFFLSSFSHCLRLLDRMIRQGPLQLLAGLEEYTVRKILSGTTRRNHWVFTPTSSAANLLVPAFDPTQTHTFSQRQRAHVQGFLFCDISH